MKKIEFLKEPAAYSNNTEFVAYISAKEGKVKFLNELSTALNFPDYFGGNWDALFDCLRDFNWIEKKGIVIVHTVIPDLSDEELRTYIEIVFDASQGWKEEEDHYLKIIFPEDSEELVSNIRKESSI